MNEYRKREGVDGYQETKIETDNDGVSDGEGGEFEFTEVAGEGLGDDVSGKGGDAGEDGRADDVPQLLGFDPDPGFEVTLVVIFSSNLVIRRDAVRNRTVNQGMVELLIIIFPFDATHQTISNPDYCICPKGLGNRTQGLGNRTLGSLEMLRE
ncbi:hypothetical protein U1Q18_050582, partial [Sarracenia purpurea var. burkii]